MPEALKKYFWDVDFSRLDYRRRPAFIAERILEFGDEKAAAWLVRNISSAQIRRTLTGSRQLSRKSAAFWAWLFDIDRGEVRCLSKSFQERQKKFWRV
ncbi:MAG: hypothetical protein P9M08_10940 [Candidatus Erginobacter occultus]|nr:hypothetical protein [Candidatus Erginobacter occultus]